MPNSSGFSDILKQHLSWHKARIDCLASIITALFVRQTVNLSALKNAFSSKAKPESIYRRMQRFFAGNLIGRTDVARFVFSVFGWQNVRLTLDRTTWEYGKSCINILVLAVVWRGVAIPVLWETLDKTVKIRNCAFLRTLTMSRRQYWLPTMSVINETLKTACLNICIFSVC